MTESMLVEQAVCYILGTKDEELSTLKVKNLAQKLGVNQAYLRYLFQNDQHMTIPQFIEREIIYRALFRLQEDFEVSIDQLSKLFGFAHVSDFEERFERIYAINPGKYQEIMKAVKTGEINDENDK